MDQNQLSISSMCIGEHQRIGPLNSSGVVRSRQVQCGEVSIQWEQVGCDEVRGGMALVRWGMRLVTFGSVRRGTVQCDLVRSSAVKYDKVWWGMDLVRWGMSPVRSGVVRYGSGEVIEVWVHWSPLRSGKMFRRTHGLNIQPHEATSSIGQTGRRNLQAFTSWLSR